MKQPSFMASLSGLAGVALDTRFLMAAILGWQILGQLLGDNRRNNTDNDEDQEEDASASNKVKELHEKLVKLQADNESLTTQVTKLQSELSSSTPTHTPTPPPPLNLPLRMNPPSPSSSATVNSARRLLNSPQTSSRSEGAGGSVSWHQVHSFRSARGARKFAGDLEADNKRLAAENEVVRHHLEAIAPGSARNKTPTTGILISPVEENERLKLENKELREHLEQLMIENEDLAERIMEVAFTSFTPLQEDDGEYDAASPMSPAWTLGHISAEHSNTSMVATPQRKLDYIPVAMVDEEEVTHTAVDSTASFTSNKFLMVNNAQSPWVETPVAGSEGRNSIEHDLSPVAAVQSDSRHCNVLEGGGRRAEPTTVRFD